MASRLNRLRWRLRMLRLALTIEPVMGGSPEGDGGEGSGGEGGGQGSGEAAGAGSGEGKGEGEGGEGSGTDWKAESRKHERRAKESFDRVKELEDKLSKIEDASKTETQKALDKARKDARKEAESEFEAERRSDRLQVAVAGHARELADVDDVVLNLERGDTDSLFDSDGKVKKDALKSALDDLLRDKPHLKASGAGKPQGSADGGEGEGGDGKSFNDIIRASARGR